MGNRMIWTRIGAYAIECEPWTISRSLVFGKPTYQLWHDNRPIIHGPVGSFESAEAAKAEAERLESDDLAKARLLKGMIPAEKALAYPKEFGELS